MASHQPYKRYQRQVLLTAMGEAGQQKLLQAKVLMIGAGGLGCPALQYLAAAGIGTLGIVDDDVVALHNLHRQPLYCMQDIGQYKTTCAKAFLENLNPELEINAYTTRLTTANAIELLSAYDIIIDGSDNFATRYLVNDACVLLGKPLVHGAIAQFEGQVAIFNSGATNEPATNYRDLFAEPPKEGSVLNCAEAGVLGVLPGIIGTMMASEVIKLVTGIGKPLINSLWTFNALNNQSYQFAIKANTTNSQLIPADVVAFKNTDYEWLCGAVTGVTEISVADFNILRNTDVVEMIDVRNPGELPVVNEFACKQIPLQEIEKKASEIKTATVVVFCQSGVRSKQAAAVLTGIFGSSRKVYSLRGGIIAWKKEANQ